MTHLYHYKVEIHDSEIDTSSPSDHTMGSSLLHYVSNKLNSSQILKAIDSIDSIEVHGIYPNLDKFMKLNPHLQEFKLLWQSKQKKDNSNSLRPIFFTAKDGKSLKLYCLTTPGKDLIIHYSSLLKTFCSTQSLDLTQKVTAYLYPEAELSIASWTRLNHQLIHPQDTVVLGYSTFTTALLKDQFPIIEITKSKFYTSTRFQLPNGEVLNSLEANFGHWGNISYHLAKKICELGAKEIIHIGRAGTLSSPQDVYKKIIIPSHFLIARQTYIEKRLLISNTLAKTQPTSRGHVAVATTLEETYIQRNILEKENIESIDIESSKIALAVEEYNNLYAKTVKFGSIHFVSDYLRKEHERHLTLEVDLTSKKSNVLKNKKAELLTQIIFIVIEYILGKESYSSKDFKAL